MIKWSTQEEDTITVNIYAPTIRASQYISQIQPQKKGKWQWNINGQIIQKTNKETQTLNNMLSQIDLIDTDRAFHSRVAEYTFFPCAQGSILQDSPHAGPQSKPQ